MGWLFSRLLLLALVLRFLVVRMAVNLTHGFRRKMVNIESKYNPQRYWEQRGQTFIQEEYQRGLYWQHDWMLDKLRTCQPEHVLEIGCGFGRNLRFLQSHLDGKTHYCGVDFSLSMLFQAQTYLGESAQPLAAADALHLPFADGSFDLVVIHGVFMHIPPEQVLAATREARRVARKHIIQCEQNYSGLQPNSQGVVKINDVTFAYDYARLFAQNGLIVAEHRSVKDLDAFLLTKRAAKYDVPEPILLEKLFPEFSHALILPLVVVGSRVLDVGCATGYLGRYFAEQKACIVDGVEPDPEAASVAKQFYRNVWVGNVENQELLEGISNPYDVVLCAAVLEHLARPDLVLKRLRRLISPDGRIIISLPNIAHWTVRWALLRGRFDYEEYGLLDRTHLRFFTIRTARQLIEDAGYHIDSFQFSTPGVTELEKPLLSLPRGGYRLRRFLLGRFPELFGYELIFVARKQ